MAGTLFKSRLTPTPYIDMNETMTEKEKKEMFTEQNHKEYHFGRYNNKNCKYCKQSLLNK